MAVTLTGTTPGSEGLFNRLGKIEHALRVLNTSRDETESAEWAGEVEDVFTLFDGVSAAALDPVLPLRAARIQGQRSLDALARALNLAAEKVVVQMFHADAPLPRQSIDEAGPALIAAMLSAGRKVDANTIAAAVTQTSLEGTGKLLASTLDGRGYPLENLLAETLRVRVVDNSTPGSELLQVLGEEEAGDRLSESWPAGSGSSKQLTSCDADGGGLLTNGDFETFTVANTPDDWTIQTGAAGTEVFSEASTVYRGTKALKIAGAATATELRQTVSGLESWQPYLLNLWCKCSGTPAAGVLKIAFYDGSSIIADEAGTNNVLTIDLTTLGTSYTAKNAFFRLPDPLPSTVIVRIWLDTALSAGTNLFIDGLSLSQAVQPRENALGRVPWLAAVSGSVNWSLGDGDPAGTTVFKVVTSNDRASEWQLAIDRLLDFGRRGWVLPTSGGGAAIDEALIA